MAIGEVENSYSQKSSSAFSLPDTTKTQKKNGFLSLSLPPPSTSPLLPTTSFNNLNDSVSHDGSTSLESEAASSTKKPGGEFKENSGSSSLWQELSSLEVKEEKSKKLKSSKLCKICRENEVCVVFLPCGHLISCSDCSTSIAKCTICSQAVKGSVKVFLA